MRRLKQALRRLTLPIRSRIYARIEQRAFLGSIRAIQETQGVAHATALNAMNLALAAYKPPTLWDEEWVNEVTQILDSVLAEQFRLQSQIEELERLLTLGNSGGDRRQETGDRRDAEIRPIPGGSSRRPSIAETAS